ncbi:MAG TPA: hypothetical protein VK739_02770 [bacterium]|nr:hypothetical protein [bacterium]
MVTVSIGNVTIPPSSAGSSGGTVTPDACATTVRPKPPGRAWGTGVPAEAAATSCSVAVTPNWLKMGRATAVPPAISATRRRNSRRFSRPSS